MVVDDSCHKIWWALGTNPQTWCESMYGTEYRCGWSMVPSNITVLVAPFPSCSWTQDAVWVRAAPLCRLSNTAPPTDASVPAIFARPASHIYCFWPAWPEKLEDICQLRNWPERDGNQEREDWGHIGDGCIQCCSGVAQAQEKQIVSE